MKLKKILALSMTLVMVGGLTACGGASEASTKSDTTENTSSAASADAVVLTYAEVNSPDSLDGKVAEYFKQQVEELSDGGVTIDIQASGVLGAENDVLDGMTTGSGTVDMARISCFTLNNYGCPESALVGVPFTFTNREQYWNFTETDLAQEILDEPSVNGLGIQGLFYMEEGFRNFFFTDEVKGIDDLKDKKIRVSSDPILTATVEQLGASPTVISFNELYSSLQSGVVDGGDQPTALYESNAFNEVSPYLLKDQHTLSASEVVMSEASETKLSEDQMNAVKEAGKKTSEYCKEISAKEEEESEARLKDKGVTIVEVTDQEPWREACKDIISKYTKGFEDKYQQILDCPTE